MSMHKKNSYVNQWIANRYGSRRGLVNAYTYRMRYFLGEYRIYKQIDWRVVQRLIFVCKGNICRSAFAEAVAHGLNIECVSCGLDTTDGRPANANAIQAAAAKGIDLTGHQTTSIHSLTVLKGDLFVSMEPGQAENLGRLLGAEHMYTLMGLWNTPVFPYIPDPYGTPEAYFNVCFNYIENSVYECAKKIGSSKK
jgi:protein-tyrosine phosphatase